MTRYKSRTLKMDKEFLEHMESETELEMKDAIRDIIGRYGRKPEMGGYDLNFLTDQMYMFIYCMWFKWRDEYQKLIKKETGKTNKENNGK